jgi:hypothetical protein
MKYKTMDKELKEKALQFIWNKGYGKGMNLTLNSVAYLMVEFAQEQVKLFAIPDVTKSVCDCPEKNDCAGYGAVGERACIACKENKQNDLCTLLATVISKLHHSESRVPYTYHHDYLRMNVDRFKGCSRSEVASKHTESKDELYAVALTQLLDELNFRDTMNLSNDDIEICKKAIEITENVVSRYNCG